MSSKRVIYFEFMSEYKVQIVDHLNKKYGWEPVFMAGNRPSNNISIWKDKSYPSCIIQDVMNLRMGQYDYNQLGKSVPIDSNITSSLSNFALNYLGIMRDPTGTNFGYDERKSFYFDILKYWNTVIHHTKPDILVLFTQPHTIACNSLYLLCKHHYKIDVVFLDPVSLLDKHYHMIGVSLDELYAPILQYYKSQDVIKIGPDSKQYIERLRSENPKMPGYILENHKSFDGNSPKFRFKRFMKIILLTFWNGYGFHVDIDWKKNKKPYYNIEVWMNNFEEFFFVEKLRNKNRKLKKHYDPLCVEVDWNKKYLYFAASYQPEASTATNAGIYEDFFLVLDILSEVIPDDWVIYYKENPTIFRSAPSNKGSLKRDKYYYDKISTYKNVEMVSVELSTFDLIDNAQVVCSVSGTVSWEAAVRGKPSMSFGNAWYLGCKSIFWIKTFHDAQKAINMIVDGYIPDKLDIERYAASIEKIAIKGMLHRNFYREVEKCKNPELELVRIAEGIKNAHDVHYPDNN
jgi:hypothetical protein